ncbi:putative ADP-ribosylation factor GTPase-activating protein AGD8 [Vitis vinifera]|uniref:Putative ADP-ribosylation factor GTPase-activating protein AGD8 n=1 Tax=Vitis vinifera TaxID=29760 RepID=A0A438EQM6_VITVI|nr:putative ADP-ribosylation factor GTPase-activating protein AGD8 [Vitis vinifera]
MFFLQYNFILTSNNYQIEESDEARRKFSNAKLSHQPNISGIRVKPMTWTLKFPCRSSQYGSTAISSADLFGHSSDNSPLDVSASDLINRPLSSFFIIWKFKFVFYAQQDYSSLKSIAGETGKKLSSLASTLMTDLQDRIL